VSDETEQGERRANLTRNWRRRTAGEKRKKKKTVASNHSRRLYQALSRDLEKKSGTRKPPEGEEGGPGTHSKNWEHHSAGGINS